MYTCAYLCYNVPMKNTNLNQFADRLLEESRSAELLVRYKGGFWQIFGDGARPLASGKYLTRAFMSALGETGEEEAAKEVKADKEKMSREPKVFRVKPKQLELNVEDKYTVYCDGSALNNGQEDASASAAAIVINSQQRKKVLGTYMGNATNNQAEIVAAAIALEAITVPSTVHIYCDSEYVIRTMAGKYKKKKNLPFWERLEKATNFHKKVTWEWVKGHSGNKLHDTVDKLAFYISSEKKADEEYFQFVSSKL